MRRTLIIGLSLATVLGVGFAIRSKISESPQASAERARVQEVGALFRFELPAPEAKKEEPAPALSLTASDGTGLKLATLNARGIVQGPLAFTEIRLAFDNPEDRTLEGTFRITLPQGAAISRFAMRINDRWQEGEVVEKQAARQAYEDFLHRKQDPALLEQSAGNEFSARVFPIPARGRKELIVSYSQQISPEAPYNLALRGLPVVSKLDAVVSRSGDDAPILGQIHLENAAPDRDLVVEAAKLPPGDGVRAGDLALLRVRPAAEAGADPVTSALVMIDTSASRALGFEAQVALVEQVAAGLGGASLVVAAFDQGIDVLYEGPASGFGRGGGDKLRSRQALGASDLKGAIDWARGKARAAGSKRVVLVTDGVPTVGETAPAKLRQAAAALKEAGVERLDALAVGGIRDDAALRGLCTAGLARDGVVIDGSRGHEQALRRLASATRSVSVKVEGAEWQWPERLDGFQPGDEALVFAKATPGAALQLRLGDAPAVALSLSEVDRPLLERAWVGAKIEQLTRKPAPEKSEADVRAEIIQLSTAFRVLSPHTALLVLETEADYARFKIDRKALADILTVEGTKVNRLRRSEEGFVGGQLPPKTAAAAGPTVGSDAPGGLRMAAPGGPRAASMDGLVDLARDAPAPGRGNTEGRAEREGGSGTRSRLERNAEESSEKSDKKESASKGASLADRAAPSPAAPPPAATATAPVAAAEPAPAPTTIPPAAPAAAAPGGFGLSGIGQGGGGIRPSIGLGSGSAGQGLGASKNKAKRPAGDLQDPWESTESNRGKIKLGTVQSQGSLSNDIVQRIVRQHLSRLRLCYEAGLRQNPSLEGRVAVRLVVGHDGQVSSAQMLGWDIPSQEVAGCVVRTSRALVFPRPEGLATVTVPLAFGTSHMPQPTATGLPSPPIDTRWLGVPAPVAPVVNTPPAPPRKVFGPYEGKIADVMEALSKGDKEGAMTLAIAFWRSSPGDVLALIALGEVFEAMGETRSAVRAYGSIIDLFPSRADLRRMAGERLERIDVGFAHSLAADSYEKAAEQRPDHPSSHRLLAYARLRAGDLEGAFDAIEAGAKRSYPSGRFRGVDRILREDAGLIAAAWIRKAPWQRPPLERRLKALGASLEAAPSLRFVLNWETDANDVDFHIRDSKGGHAYYGQKSLPSGGDLYDDVTTGYGPECFTIRKAEAERSGPYSMQGHYYSRGPMGYGMGKLEIIDHDGSGGLKFEERPFLIMQDRAYVDMGSYPAGAPAAPKPGGELPRP